MSEKFSIKVMLENWQGRTILCLFLTIYILYFLSALMLVCRVSIDILLDKSAFDISEGKAILYVLFIGHILYVVSNPKLLKSILKYDKFDKIFYLSLFLSMMIVTFFGYFRGY